MASKGLEERTNDANAAVAALRQATREAHEATAGLREVARQAEATKAEVAAMIASTADELRQTITDAMGVLITEGIADYHGALAGLVEKAEDRVNARFDSMVGRLLGVEPGQGEPLEDMLGRWLTQQKIMIGGMGLGKGRVCPSCGAGPDAAHGPGCEAAAAVAAMLREAGE